MDPYRIHKTITLGTTNPIITKKKKINVNVFAFY